ncbi:MAG TPA: lysylphosphatidylglycerol synthase transmembrane domain-containing protein [Acidimicrobiales bacterium]|nr:lysylphosphatidylglycerol synthase transmembrane domain-containing protein [Acidimicrobiales bacterium]
MSDADDLSVSPPRRRFARSAGDVRRLIDGVVLLTVAVLLAAFAPRTVGAIESDVADLLRQVPDDALVLAVGLAQLLAVVGPTIIGVALLVQRRFAVVGLFLVVNVVAAFVTDALLGVLTDRGGGPAVLAPTEAPGWFADPSFPAIATVASAAAVATVASRTLERRWSRPVVGVVVLLALLRLITTTEPAFDVLVAVAVGIVVGSLALLIAGAPDRRPGWEQLRAALADVGTEPTAPHAHQPLGVASPLRWIVTTDGVRALIVRSPEDSDVEFFERVGRSVRLRSEHVAPRLGSPRRRLEHEALVLGLAERAGARVPSVQRLLRAGGESMAALVDVPAVPPLAAVPSAAVDDLVLADAWAQVAALRRAGIAHRALDLQTILLERAAFGAEPTLLIEAPDDTPPAATGPPPLRPRVWLVDFDEAEAAASEVDLARDVVSLLVVSALVAGVDRAVEAALDGIGPEALGAALPLLQPLALTPATRRAVGDEPELLHQLRAEVEARSGAPAAEPVELRRVRPRTVVGLVVASLAFYVLLPQLATVEEAAGVLADADPAWLVLVVGAALVTYLTAASALVAAAGPPVRWWPAVRSQVASKFVSVITPGPTGDLAVKVRFLQRSGLSSGAASAASGLTAAGGFITHVALLALSTVWVGRSGGGEFGLPDRSTIALIGAAVVLIGVIVLATPVGRRRLLAPAVQFVRSGFGQIVSLARRPARLGALLAGAAGTTLANGVVLVAAVEALGGGPTVPQVLAIYLAGAALATAAPTPGGLGALEAALVAGLAGFGLDEGRAIAAVLTFRLATFWLPVLPGWLTFTWMQRRQEL